MIGGDVVRQVHQPILPWIDCHPDRMSRDGTDGAIVKDGLYDDDIPHIHLPWDWFARNQKEVRSDAGAPATPPAPATPKEAPISFEDARILTGRDTSRIMRGAPRKHVIERRKAILAGEVEELDPVNPIPAPVMKQVWRHVPAPPKDRMPKIALRQYHDMSNNTWVNVSGEPIPIDFPNSEYKFVLQPHEGVWLTPMVFELQRFKVGQVLPASEVHRLSLIGKMELDEDLKRSLRQSGIKVKEKSQ